VPRVVKAIHAHLQALDGRIHIADSTAERTLLAQYMPRLQGLAQFQRDAPMLDRSIERESEFALRFKPGWIKAIAGLPEVAERDLRSFIEAAESV